MSAVFLTQNAPEQLYANTCAGVPVRAKTVLCQVNFRASRRREYEKNSCCVNRRAFTIRVIYNLQITK